MIVTTNRSVAWWGKIFTDAMMAAAILDRFLFRATLLAINGDSYRMRAHRERLKQLWEGVTATTKRWATRAQGWGISMNTSREFR
jgi:hypothetical protein